MSNPFETGSLLKSLSNYPVSKGDVPGHEFHGNQYTDGEGGGVTQVFPANAYHGVLDQHEVIEQTLADTKKQLARPAGREYYGTVGDADHASDLGHGVADAHMKLMKFHAEQEKVAEKAGESRIAELHRTAITENRKAYNAGLRYARQADTDADHINSDATAARKVALTEKLLDYSKKAMRASQTATGL